MPALVDDAVANIPTFDAASPSEDPAYLAFLRQQGYSEAQAKADAARRMGILDRQLAEQLPNYADQERLGIQQVQGSAEANGVLKSGKTLVDAQQVSTDVGRARNAYESNVSDQRDQIISDLTRQIADYRRQQAENALNARGNILKDAASAGAFT